MEEFIEKNVDKIVNKVDDLFRDKIGPFIEKTIQDQKAKLVEDFLSQIKTSYARELNGSPDQSKTDIKSSINQVKSGWHFIHHLVGEKYEYNSMKDLLDWFNELIKKGHDNKGMSFYYSEQNPWLEKFLTNLKTGEYPIYLYCTCMSYSIYKMTLFTNFGSYFHAPGGNCQTNNYDHEIPWSILLNFIHISYTGDLPFVIEDIEKYNPNEFNISLFSKSVEHFQKWWIEYPLIGYKAEMLKKENEKIREEVEKTKQEHESIKHMYETLELKDQYYKAVELLKQNKVEREAIEQARKDLALKKEKQEEKIREEYEKLDQKAKKLREIEDIDREFSKLALMKQKLEKKKKEFQKEKAEFDDLKSSLMEDSDS
jgi:hypothetical protein